MYTTSASKLDQSVVYDGSDMGSTEMMLSCQWNHIYRFERPLIEFQIQYQAAVDATTQYGSSIDDDDPTVL